MTDPSAARLPAARLSVLALLLAAPAPASAQDLRLATWNIAGPERDAAALAQSAFERDGEAAPAAFRLGGLLAPGTLASLGPAPRERDVGERVDDRAAEKPRRRGREPALPLRLVHQLEG